MATIAQLSSVSKISGGDSLPIGSTALGGDGRVTMAAVLQWLTENSSLAATSFAMLQDAASAPIATQNLSVASANAALLSAINVLTNSVVQKASQTDLAAVSNTLAGKQAALVSGTSIRSVNGTSLLGSGNINVSGTALPGQIAFTPDVPLDGNVTMALKALTTSITLTQASSPAPADGGQCKIVFQPDGVSTVTLPAGWKPFVTGGQDFSQTNYSILYLQYDAATATAYYGWALGPVFSASDTTPPTITSATVSDSAPSVIQLVFSEPMQSAMPAASAFAVSSGHAVTAVAYVDSTHVNLTVGTPFIPGETKTLAYTQPGTNNLKDLAGNLLANVTAQAIPDSVGYPTITSIVVANGSPTVINLTFSENIQSTMPAVSAFAVNSGHPLTAITYVDATHVNLTTSTAFVASETKTLSYTLPGSNPIKDSGGSSLQSFSGTAITDNVSAGGASAVRARQFENSSESGPISGLYGIVGGNGGSQEDYNYYWPSGVSGSVRMRLDALGAGAAYMYLYIDSADATTPNFGASSDLLEAYINLGDGAFKWVDRTSGTTTGSAGVPAESGGTSWVEIGVNVSGGITNLYCRYSTNSGSTWSTLHTSSTVSTQAYYLKSVVGAVGGSTTATLMGQTGMTAR